MRDYFASTSATPSEAELAHQDTVQQIAEECVVLMRNDGILPFDGIATKVALYGNGARNTIHGGGGSGNVNARETVTLEQAFAEAGWEVTSTAWMDLNDRTIAEAEAAYWERIRARAAELGMVPKALTLTDHFRVPDQPLIDETALGDPTQERAVFVVSRRTREGEDIDAVRGSFLLSEAELVNLRTLAAHYGEICVLLNTGAPIDMAELATLPGKVALVHMGQLGNTGTRALVRILMGKAVPSGKLADTWAWRYDDYPEAEAFRPGHGSPDDVDYREGIYVGYRYFDTFGVQAAYAFGHGLSYTSFEVEATGNCPLVLEGAKATLTCKVRNTGNTFAGKEVVQLYAGYEGEGLPMPAKQLVAFAKTPTLEPGAEAGLELCFSLSDLAAFAEARAAWVLQGGVYPLYLGTSSADVACVACIRVEADVVVEHCQLLFPDTEPVQEYEAPVAKSHVDQNVPVLTWDGTGLEPQEHAYTDHFEALVDTHPDHLITYDEVLAGIYSMPELVAQLTDEQMAWMCIGSIETDVKDIVGSSSGLVPGAAGDTCHILAESRHVPNLVMADGPAGLRLVPEFKDEGQTFYQYCTALPTAVSMAQTWNCDLVEAAGEVVGDEMSTFGVKLWLAPALNIHRNPLGGRNFEYFSEDPLLSARFAIAWTKAVQAHPGRGVVIKHFACNNQEDLRLYVNEHISERALRELYLKGFQKVVQEAQPASVMAAYNLINGTHCASSYALIQNVLRDEWGYEGMVMTDWFSTQDIKSLMSIGETRYSHTDPGECVHAGVSIQMPGNKLLVNELVEDVNEGLVARADLQRCVLALLSLIARLEVA